MRVGKNQPSMKDMLGTKTNPNATNVSSRYVDTCQDGGQGGNRNSDILDEEYNSGTETVLARLARPDWKNGQAGKCGRVSGPIGALESGGGEGGGGDAKQYGVMEMELSAAQRIEGRCQPEQEWRESVE